MGSVSLRDRMLAQVKKVTPLPATAVELIPLLQNPETDIATIGKAIKHDPGLSANVLSLANSSLYGGGVVVESIDQALARLGTKRMLSLVCVSAVAPVAQDKVDGYGLDEGVLWEHAVAVAIATEEFAAVLKIPPPPGLFAVGLLHDIGKIVTGSFVGSVKEEIQRLAFEKGMSYERAEQQALGMNHTEIGALLAEQWNLPPNMIAGIRWHDQPERCPEQYRTIAELVHIADYICTTAGLGGGDDGTNYVPSSDTFSRLNVTTKLIEAVMCATSCRIQEVRGEFAMAPQG